jgi:hypothetical protein
MSSTRDVRFAVKHDGKQVVKMHLNSKKYLTLTKTVAYNQQISSFMPRKYIWKTKGSYNRINSHLS